MQGLPSRSPALKSLRRLASTNAARGAAAKLQPAAATVLGVPIPRPREQPSPPSPASPAALWTGQDQLPRFPVPTLEGTVERIRSVLQPFLRGDTEKEEAEEALAEFQQSRDVRKAQQVLTSMASSPSTINWLEPIFDNSAYFSSPLPLPINFNFALGLGGPPCSESADEAEALQPGVHRAAALLYGLLDFRRLILSGELEPLRDAKTGNVTDSSQYLRLFNHCRIPGDQGDHNLCFLPPHTLAAAEPTVGRHQRTIYRRLTKRQGNHIVFLCGGKMATVEVVDGSTGVPLTVETIEERLEEACRKMMASEKSDDISPAVLSTQDRRAWTRHRKQLQQQQQSASLEAVESAICVVALDDDDKDIHTDGNGNGTGDSSTSTNTKRFLCRSDGANRFYDKHQLIVNRATGQAALLVEHSSVDGGTVLHLVKHIKEAERATTKSAKKPSASLPLVTADELTLKESDDSTTAAETSRIQPPQARSKDAVRLLSWSLSPSLVNAVRSAREKMREEASRLDCELLTMGPSFGEPALRAITLKGDRRLSPDSFAQIAFQAAHARLAGATTLASFVPAVSVYESTSLRGYRHGRTEITRSCTPEVAAFVGEWTKWTTSTTNNTNNRQGTEEHLRDLLLSALRSHSSFVKAAKEGMGIDRHLLGLKHVLSKATAAAPTPNASSSTPAPSPAPVPAQLPRLFSLPSFEAASRWTLSTSNCSSPDISFFAFGPVVPEGFGLGYCFQQTGLSVHISSWRGGEGEKEGGKTSANRSVAFVRALKQTLEELRALVEGKPLAGPQQQQKRRFVRSVALA